MTNKFPGLIALSALIYNKLDALDAPETASVMGIRDLKANNILILLVFLFVFSVAALVT